MELLRPTGGADDGPDDAQADNENDGAEGRGDDQGEANDAGPKTTRRSRRKPPASERSKPRNVRLSDDVHDRLWMLSREKGKTVSAVANDLLDRALPKWEIKRQS